MDLLQFPQEIYDHIAHFVASSSDFKGLMNLRLVSRSFEFFVMQEFHERASQMSFQQLFQDPGFDAVFQFYGAAIMTKHAMRPNSPLKTVIQTVRQVVDFIPRLSWTPTSDPEKQRALYTSQVCDMIILSNGTWIRGQLRSPQVNSNGTLIGNNALQQVAPAYAAAVGEAGLLHKIIKNYRYIVLNASHMFPSALEAAIGSDLIHVVKEPLRYLYKNFCREQESGSWQEMCTAARSIRTALRMALRMERNEVAAELVKFFDDNDVFKNSLNENFGEELMRDSLVYGNLEPLLTTMNRKRTPIDSKKKEQERNDMVDILLDVGADVNGIPKIGKPRTILQYAASIGSVDYVLFFLKLGADPDHSNIYGDSPVLAVTENEKPECKFLIKMARHHGSSYVQRKNIWKLYEAQKGNEKENYGVIWR